MAETQVGTLVWHKYKEPPKDPDSNWIVETVKNAFAYPSSNDENEEKEKKNRKKQKGNVGKK